MAVAAEAGAPARAGGTVTVVAGASVGTVFEWYDFFLYGSLAGFITQHFFSGVNEVTGYIFALLAFAAGFAVRPLGAVVFGRLGDLWGRKNTFLVTMLIMGLSTFTVGLLPSYASIGVAAPVLLITLRLLQGLAVGGEYGGAAIYVAEHAPHGKRGLYTSWIQTTATLGLFLSLLVILIVRTRVGEDVFKAWGWRAPFLLSIFLLGVSLWIRLRLNESPIFRQMVDEGRTSKAPLTESFANRRNVLLMLGAFAGLCAGQAVVWYASQFYALFFLEKMLKVDGALANSLMAVALALATPFFVVAGWLSDRVGRRVVILGGCLLAAATYFPIFHGLTVAANPDLAAATARAPVVVVADPATCHFQFDPVGKQAFTSGCDVAKSALANAGVSYRNQAAAPGAPAVIRIGEAEVASLDGTALPAGAFKAAKETWTKALSARLKAIGYPPKADPAKVNRPMVVGLLFLLVIYATMAYGPIAAALVEMFPARIRYTSMSLPYHLGAGWLGGFLPTTAFAMVAATGDIYFGLWYPVVIAVISAGIGFVFLKEMNGAPIDA